MRAYVWLIVWGVIGLLTATATGRDIYVSNVAGNDSFSGQQTRPLADGSGPLRTIQRALRVANAGDVIILENTGSPYRESISLVGKHHSGFPDQPFVIRGNGATLEGSRAIPVHAWENFRGAIFRFQPIRAGYQQLFVNDLPAVRVAIGGAGGIPELKPLQWCMGEGWLYFCVEPNKMPADYKLACADLQTGVTLYHVSNVAICDLVVQGFQSDGISAFNSARGVRIANVTSQGNGRAGITVGGASVAEIDSALLNSNGLAEVLTLPFSEAHVRNSVLQGNTGMGWVDQGGKFFLETTQLKGGLNHYDPLEKQAGKPTEDGPKP